ncbi:MAG: DMT family transporter [Candidatus Aminicenantales bacterium]
MRREDNKKFGLTDVLMLLTILIWAANFSVVKVALREFSPHGFNGLRLIMTSFLLLLWLWASGERFTVVRRDLWKLLVIGFFGNTVYQILFIQGIHLSTASNAALILSMTPIFVALISSLLKYEKIHWGGWLGIFISFFGLYLVISKQNGGLHFSSEYLRGDLMVFAGMILWASYTVFSKPFLNRISPLKWTTVTMVFGTIFYLPIAAGEIARISWPEISLRAWASLLYSALFSLVIGIVIWYYSVKKVGNSKTAIYNNLTPVFAAFFAFSFLGERISSFQAVGALIILAGVYLTRSGYRYFIRRERNSLQS